MGSALTAMFGGGESTSQRTQADPISQAMNKLRYEQLANLFGVSPYYEYSRPAQGGEYTAAPEVQQLLQQAMQGGLSNLMSFEDYKKLGLDATSNYISQIAKPEILSTAALQGLEGGGMVPEALAKATAQIGLPFVQSLPGASAALTMAPAQYASTLFPLADYSRALKEQDLLRRQGVMQTALTGLPYTPGSSSSGSKSSQPMFNFFGQG